MSLTLSYPQQAPPDVSYEPRSVVRMGTKSDRNLPAWGECARADVAPLVEQMVEDKHAERGSRELAQLAVARLIGRSPSWVRKLVHGYDGGLNADTYRRILDAYAAHCARIEVRAAARRERAVKLMEEAHAIRHGVVGQPPRDRG